MQKLCLVILIFNMGVTVHFIIPYHFPVHKFCGLIYKSFPEIYSAAAYFEVVSWIVPTVPDYPVELYGHLAGSHVTQLQRSQLPPNLIDI